MKTFMATTRAFEVAVLGLVSGIALTFAFDAAGQTDHSKVMIPDQLTYQAMEGLPACMTSATIQGDPAAGAATLVLKFAPGCNIPMHWHSANEQIVLIKGNGMAQMKGETSQPVSVSEYRMLPAKEPHRFACGAGDECLLYLFTDGKFDIHWVDAQGAEIPLDQAEKADDRM